MSEPENSSLAADDRNIVLLTHLLGILTGFVGSLVVWLIHKDKPEKTFVNEQAKEALNFQITVALAWVIAMASSFILIGALLFPVIFIGNVVFCVLAAVAVSNGKSYSYPIALRLIK